MTDLAPPPTTSAAAPGFSAEGAYDAWSPSSSTWSAWTKPVLFTRDRAVSGLPIPDWRGKNVDALVGGARCAFVVDLPGAEGLAVAVALAARGHAPIPLYNGVAGEGTAVLDTRGLVDALHKFAGDLGGLRIPDDAPPAFVVDADRMTTPRAPLPGVLDNRWLVFPQDLPSAAFLSDHRITRAVLVSQRGLIADDLAHVLLRWQKAGIEILASDASLAAPRATTVPTPPRFRAIWYRALAMLGLRKSAGGGFGSVIPVPQQGGG